LRLWITRRFSSASLSSLRSHSIRALRFNGTSLLHPKATAATTPAPTPNDRPRGKTSGCVPGRVSARSARLSVPTHPNRRSILPNTLGCAEDLLCHSRRRGLDESA
jgi:hypothetical protein